MNSMNLGTRYRPAYFSIESPSARACTLKNNNIKNREERTYYTQLIMPFSWSQRMSKPSSIALKSAQGMVSHPAS